MTARRLAGAALATAITATLLTAVTAPVAAAAPPTDTAVDVATEVTTAVADDGRADYWVLLDERADLSGAATIDDWADRGQHVYDALRATAEQSQKDLLADLAAAGAVAEPFWAANAVLVHGGDTRSLDIVRTHTEVDAVTTAKDVALPKPAPASTDPADVDGVEWGVAAVGAPEVWAEYGTRGEGVVVGSIDSGAQFDHPALAGSYRGNLGGGAYDHNHNWYDPASVCASAAPCDNTGHGTHTIGTIAGDGGPGNAVGVAPGARWISAKGCETTSCSIVSLASAMQWMLAPTDLTGQNPRPDLRPQVVNNSWGGGGGVDVLHEMVKAWVAAGIVPMFSAGNDGEFGCRWVGAPGVYPESIAVAAHDDAGRVAYFSSRGPSYFDYDEIKPDVAAPGVNVRSALPGNAYGAMNGTSMAAPHATGAVALALSAAPALAGDVEQLRGLLENSANPVDDRQCDGHSDDNSVYGHGRIDVHAMVAAAPRGAAATVTGIALTQAGKPLSGGTVEVTNGEFTRWTTISTTGAFRVPVLAGRVTVTVWGWGWKPIRSTVDVQAGRTANVNAILTPAANHAVTGTVTRPDGSPAYGVDVVLTGTPLAPVRTRADGRFSWDAVPEGRYLLSTGTARCVRHTSTRIGVDGAEDLTVALRATDDPWGTTCVEQPSEWVTADQPLPIHDGGGGHYEFDVPLPFSFRYYGEFVDKIRVHGEGRISTRDPNHEAYGQIAVFQSELFFLDDSALRTTVIGTAPNRTFVVEWHNMQGSYYNSADGLDYQYRVSFEALLGEDGSITMQWNTDGDTPDPLLGRHGAYAVAGVFHHQYQPHMVYLPGKPVLRKDNAVRFVPPAAGVLSGVVRDANDDAPVPSAVVTVRDEDVVLRRVQVRPDGSYHIEVPLGEHTVTVTAAHYRTHTQRVAADRPDQRLTMDPALTTGVLDASVDDITLATVHGGRKEYRVQLSNPGTEPVTYRVAEAAARAPGTAVANWNPGLPARLTGVAADPVRGTVWTSARDAALREYTTDGAETGTQWELARPDESVTEVRQLTYDTRRQDVCGVVEALRADRSYFSGIRCLDPETGALTSEVSGEFTHLVYTNFAQASAALAYRADDDSFYVSDVDALRRAVVHVAGPSHATPGAVLGSCELARSYATGLAWQESTGELLAQVYAGEYFYGTERVLRIEPDSCAELGYVENRTGEVFGPLGIDAGGRLWGGTSGRVVGMEPAVPDASDVPWLTLGGATSGTIAPGGTVRVTATVDAEGLAEGEVRRAQLVLTGDAGRAHGLTQVPVTAVHPRYQVGINAGGGGWTDGNGDRWVADRRYKRSGYGWTGTSEVLADGRLPEVLDRDARSGDLTYEFHDVPDGTYVLELRFADSARYGRTPRVFDVVADGRLVLDGYRPPKGRGDVRSIPVTVTGGVARVDFLPVDGYAPPLVTAIRLTDRPDLAG